MALRLSQLSIQAKLSFFLFLIPLLVYANTLGNNYAFDDFFVIKYNSIVTKGISAIPEIFSTPYFRGDFVSANDYYRPLSLAMFAAEYQLSGGQPFISHLINILLFAGCVVLLFRFLNSLFAYKRTAVAFIASLLFALHPVNTEVVANIKSRDQLLCFLFAFLALNIFARFVFRGRPAQLVAGAMLFFLSFLSKETAITFLGIFPLVFFFYKNQNKRRSWYVMAATAMVAVVYLVIRRHIISAGNAHDATGFSFLENPLAHAPSYASRLATAVFVMGYYLKLLFIPYPLICDYSFHTFPFTSFADIRVLLSLIAYVALVAIGLYRLVKKNKDPYAFAILFYLVSLSLYTNIVLLIGTIMGERFLFFPVIGFCLVIALFVEKLAGMPAVVATPLLVNKKAMIFLVPLCVCYAFIVMGRNTEWRDNYALLSADVQKAPHNCRLWYDLGTVKIIDADTLAASVPDRAKLVKDGIGDLRRAIAIYPAYDLAWSEAGNVFFHNGNFDSASVYCSRAIALNPRDAASIKNLAGIFFKTKKYQQSLQLCKRSIALDSSYFPGYRNMGNCYLMMAKYDSAIYVYKKAIVLDPSVNAAYERLAIAYKFSNNMDSAAKYLQIAQVNNPGFSY